jgi:hypothetical protein
MATVLPPPSKRQRTDAADRARQQQDVEVTPSDAGSLRLQFYDETTGLPIGQGPVLVPVADATPKNLELLLNTLQGHVRSDTVFFLVVADQVIGFLRAHPISIYPASTRQEERRQDYHSISCEHLENVATTRLD